MKVPDSNKIISLLYIGGALLLVVVLYKILAAVGLIKTGAKKREEKAESEAEEKLRSLDYFNPLLLKKYPDYKTIYPLNRVTAEALRKALRGLGTNEEAVFMAFGKLPNKLSISEVTLAYKVAYNRDLGTDLMNDLTDAEQVTLLKIIDKLPKN